MGGCVSSGPSRPPLQPFLSTPFANYLTAAQLTTFSAYFTELTYAPSSIIFRTGDAAGDYYMFLTGQAHVFAEHKFLCEKAAGDTINTTVITAASLSSPTALKQLSASPLPRHTCSLHAITTTRLLYLPHKRLVEYIRNNPDTSTLLLPLLACPFVSLSALAFFSSMPGGHLHTLSCYMLRMQALKPTETLFEEGSLGQSVYILQAGQLKAVAALTSSTDAKDTKDSKDKPAADANPGETEKVLHIFRDSNADDRIFGEIALCMDIPRTASIISMSNSIVLEWKREDYRTFTSLLQSTAQSMASLQQMMKARTAEHFRKYKVPFFSSIPEEKYAILASLCKIEERGAGEVIFQEGERGSEFYLIAYGQVRVTMRRKRKDGAAGALKGVDGVDGGGASGEDKARKNDADDGYAAMKGGKGGTIKGSATGTIGKNKRGKSLIGTLRLRRQTAANNSNNPSTAASTTAPLASLLALDDDSVEICRMGPGKYFGEIALVQDTPRTATVTAVSRCIILSITKENFTLFFHEAPEAISDFEIKLARYDVQLRSVLYHPLGLQWFRRHCEREYAGENVDFWLRCREYRHRSMEAMGKEREDRRKARRDERVRRDRERAGGAGAAGGVGGVKVGGSGAGSSEAKGEEEKAGDGGGGGSGKKEEKGAGKEEEESAEFADSDYIDAEEDTSDFQYLQRVSRQSTYTSYLLSQLSTLFTVFSLSSSISRTTSLSITASQLKSLILMLDIYISDYQLDELCVALHEHNDTIAFRPLVDTCLTTTHAPNPSATTTDRILRKLCRRICQYDVADIRRVFEQTAKTKRGFLNLAEFTHTLKRLHIRVRSKDGVGASAGVDDNDEQDVSMLFFRLAQPLSFSTRMASNHFQLSFPIFLSFILNHFHYHESFYGQLLVAAQSIYDTYISSSSVHQVNIKGRTQAAVAASLAQQQRYQQAEEAQCADDDAAVAPTEDSRNSRRAARRYKWTSLGVHLFDEGEDEVLSLLGADTFARFKQSELFQEFLNSAQAYVEVKAGGGAGTGGGGVGKGAGAAGGAGEAPMGDAERETMRRVGEEIRRGKMLRSGSVVRETEKRPAALPPPPKISATLGTLPSAKAAPDRAATAITNAPRAVPPTKATPQPSTIPPPPSHPPPPPATDPPPPPPPPADDAIPPPPSARSIPPPPPAAAAQSSYPHTAVAASYAASTVKRRGILPPFNAQLYSASTLPRQQAAARPVVSAAMYAAPLAVQPSGVRALGVGDKFVEEKQMESARHMQPVTIMLDPFQSRY